MINTDWQGWYQIKIKHSHFICYSNMQISSFAYSWIFMKTYLGEIDIKYRETKQKLMSFCLFTFILWGNCTTHFLDMFIMLIKLATVRLVSIRTWCFHYFQKTRSPSHNFFVAKKKKKKCNPPDFQFYLDKLTNTKFPLMMSCLFWVCNQTQNYHKVHHMGKVFIS